MITIWNSQSIFIGKDLKEFNRIRDCLEQQKIPYRYKTNSRMGQWTGRGTVRSEQGSAGIAADAVIEYEILIHKKDLERVKL